MTNQDAKNTVNFNLGNADGIQDRLENIESKHPHDYRHPDTPLSQYMKDSMYWSGYYQGYWKNYVRGWETP